MPGLLMQYWHTLSARAERARERRFLEAARRGMGACACAAPPDHITHDGATRKEHLEYIALLAYAGYFGMGWTIDVFQPPVDMPPD